MPSDYGWVTSDEIKDYVGAALKRAGLELKPEWDIPVERARKRAYWTIIDSFIKRGYSKAQIDQWDRGEEFQADLATYFSLLWMGVLNPDATSQNILKEVDRRPELVQDEDMNDITLAILTIGGELVTGDVDYGQVRHGALDTSSDYFGRMPGSEEDSRVGDVMRL